MKRLFFLLLGKLHLQQGLGIALHCRKGRLQLVGHAPYQLPLRLICRLQGPCDFFNHPYQQQSHPHGRRHGKDNFPHHQSYAALIHIGDIYRIKHHIIGLPHIGAYAMPFAEHQDVSPIDFLLPPKAHISPFLQIHFAWVKHIGAPIVQFFLAAVNGRMLRHVSSEIIGRHIIRHTIRILLWCKNTPKFPHVLVKYLPLPFHYQFYFLLLVHPDKRKRKSLRQHKKQCGRSKRNFFYHVHGKTSLENLVLSN